MAQSIWADGSLSIVLLPSGEQGESLMRLAQEWTNLKFLGPALWVRPEDVAIRQGSPPRITATVFGHSHGGDAAVVRDDLFELLARQSLRLVRLVTVRSVAPDKALDADQDAIAAVVATYVRHSVPQEVPGSDTTRQRNDLSRIDLICAPTEYQLQERVSWVRGDETVTLVASPEDRVTPWAGDAFVRDDHRFPGFVLMHAATAAGLWNGLPIGLVEMIDRDRSAAGNVWISRVFVAGVMTEGLAQQASIDVLRQAADPSSHIIDPYSGVLADGTSPIPSDQTDGYRARMVEHAMDADHAVLKFAPADPVGPRDRERVGIGEQLARFLRFCASVIGNAPRAYWGYLRAGVARMLGRRLQGADGMLLVGEDLSGLDARDRAIAQSLQRIHAEQQRVDVELSQPVPRFTVRSTPALWSRLREMVFGSLDGSGDPEDRGFEAVEGRIPVFGRVTDVIHDPLDTWAPPAELRSDTMPTLVEPLDWRAHDEVRDRLDIERGECDEQATELGARMTALEKEAAELAGRRRDLEDILLDSGALRITKAGDIAPGKRSRENAGADDDRLLGEYRAIEPALRLNARRQGEASTERTLLAARIARLDEVEHDFSAWQDRQGANVGAHLIRAIAAEQQTAAREGAALQKQIAGLSIPEPGALRRLRDAHYRRTAVLFGVLLAAAAIMIVPLYWPDPSRLPGWWPDWWWTAGTAVALFVVIGGGFLIGYYRRWSGFNRSLIETEARIHSLNDAAVHARREEYRLGTLLEQARSWLDLLAGALRKPWKAREDWAQRAGRAPDPNLLPFAMRIARAEETDAESSRKLQRTVAEALVRRGWRASVFRELLDSIRDTQSIDAHSIDLDALDNDLPHLPNHARTILRENMHRDAVLESVAQKRLDALERQVEFESLYGAATLVRPFSNDPLRVLRSDGVRSDTVAWDDFLTGALGEADDVTTPLTPLAITPFELQRGHHLDVSSYVLTPRRLAHEMQIGTWRSLHLREYEDRSASQFDVVVRVDLAGPVPIEAVRLGVARSVDLEVIYEGIALPTCPKCGRTNCPAADPTSGRECTFAGV